MKTIDDREMQKATKEKQTKAERSKGEQKLDWESYYLQWDLINSNGGVRLFRGVRFFGLLQKPIALWGLTMHPPFPTILFQKSDHTHSFSLAKYRIHVDGNLKEQLTDLFWKLLLGYHLFPQAEC